MTKKLNLALKGRIIEKYGTQGDFAPEVGIREDRLSRLINGRNEPKPEQARKIAAALGCDVRELFPGNGVKIEPEYFDLAGASAYLGGAWEVRTLRRLIAQPGGLPYYRVGRGKVLIRRTDLEGFLEAHRHEPLDLDALADQAIRELRGQP